MNKISLLFIALTLGLSGCTKKDDEKTKDPVMEISVSGIKNIDYKYIPYGLPLSVKKKSGPSQQLSLSVYGLPNGMKDSFDKNNDTPDLNTMLTFRHYLVVKGGVYPLQIIATNQATGAATVAKMNLTIPDGCGPYLSGDYNLIVIEGSTHHVYVDSFYRVRVDAVNPNRLHFTYYRSSIGPSWVGDMNCSDFSISIPANGTTTYKGYYDPLLQYIEITEKKPGKTDLVYQLSRW